MTTEEREQYNKLSELDREEYDLIKKKHPNWSHSQIITKLGVSVEIGKRLEKGEDVNPDDPTVIEEILKGAKKFLKRCGIIIKEVFEAIDEVLTDVGNKLKDFWDWLWDYKVY